jgi:hypothetical protein
MLWSARTVIQSTVALLQLSDNYDIRKVALGCLRCSCCWWVVEVCAMMS